MDIAYMKTSVDLTNDSNFVHSDFIEQNLGIAIPYLNNNFTLHFERLCWKHNGYWLCSVLQVIFPVLALISNLSTM